MSSKHPRLWLAALAVAVFLALFHASILEGLAGYLIVDEPAGDCDCVCLRAWGYVPEGDRCFDAAGSLCGGKQPRQVLLLAPRADRLAEIGVLPSFETLCRRELEKRCVPQQAISAIPGGGYNDWDAARSLGGWLDDHPDSSVLLFNSRFQSAQMRRILDAVLDPDQAARVRIWAIPDRRCDETNWWKSRHGFRAFGICWLMRIQNWCGGGNEESPPLVNADDYEQNFLRSLEEKNP